MSTATLATAPRKQATATLALAALGVVYGDIGTSPLYTIKTIFDAGTGVPLNPATVVGAVSVVFWALMLVVTLKYVVLITRADNKGEGGIMALLALASRTVADRPALRSRLLVLGAFGACLFYGDAVLTPAISVLSAVEGLEVVTPTLKPWVLPASVGILVALFAVQSRGTAAVGRWFGPVIVLWFSTLAAVGMWQIAQAPEILQALDPRHAWRFLAERGWGLFLAVGAVVLAITGAEALYADMGHFGKGPIRLAWSTVVLPALALNYAGQGALLLRVPAAASNPFYLSFPEGLLLPAVALATAATIIASQAVISGAYSLTQQAMQLGFLPRMTIVHTSAHERGQIYIPAVNGILLVAVVLACLFFGTSSSMASAYGIAVTGTMLITTLLTYFVVRRSWGYPAWVAIGATAFFVALDTLLLASCSVKVLEGGWFPLVLAAGLLAVMSAWKRGRELLSRAVHADTLTLPDFVAGLDPGDTVARVDRTAVFLSAERALVPQALLHNIKHNLVLHRRNIVLTVEFADEPTVAPADRLRVRDVGRGFWQAELRFGFTEQPNVPQALELAGRQGLDIDPFDTSYFLSRETVVPRPSATMSRWRQHLFETLSRNAGRAVDFFGIPANSVIELGTRVQI
ncbi:potassium transporter Kup [Ramlibacter tataouinensis]|uniref:Probable potassium transport system protein Kup n=1 Tax=Ramlibacter tataouinensis (strain ATCC BAA-407 / DSM 14655 / LMG 21543 / TTB310) TaxID=365046 RepID=F5Y4D9_RAMTT|nr:potassium transporter Kup [Ramlibacter tataouinensis]AEG93786.1 Candidate K+ transporter [Ramlibacter tataouinensis TTB310]